MVFKFEHPENRHQRFYANHREEIKIQQKERKQNMTEEQREDKREYERTYSKTEKFKRHRHLYYQKLVEKYKTQVFEKLGNKCVRCGFSDNRGFQVDHINGGGHKQRGIMNAVKFFKYVLNHLEEFQLLCANCNQIKRIENKEN
jgi:hypothetical protein